MIKSNSCRLVGFLPIVDKQSKILILGSMPGIKSLEKNQYYGNPLNHFWKIMGHLLKKEIPASYEQRQKILLKRKIALWDTVYSCERAGSLDAAINNIQVNDFAKFLNQHPRIQAIFCNGKTSYHLFKRYYPDCEITTFSLPSTSPANTMALSHKLAQWKEILNFLE